MAELPMLAQPVELPATLMLPSPQTPAPALPMAGLSARHLGTSHDSCSLPASHLDIPAASALPLSAVLHGSGMATRYFPALVSTRIFLLGW